MLPKLVILLVCLSVVKATFTVNAYQDEDNEIDSLAEEAVERSARSCILERCHNVCRRQGYPSGYCVGKLCRCRGQRALSAVLDAEDVIPEIGDVSDESAVPTQRSCEYTECNTFCRKMGYARGVCIGTYCQCRSRSAAAADRAPEIPKPEIGDVSDEYAVPNQRSCEYSECNTFCRKMGYARGVCIGTYCQCRSRSAAAADRAPEIPKPASDEIREASALKSCSLQDCEQFCRRLGFTGGACVNGRCACDILRSAAPLAESDFESDDIAEPAPPAPRALKDCNPRACEQSCRRIFFKGGVCVNGHCKCDILRSAPQASDDNIDEIANDANPEDDAAADGGDSSENSVY